MNEPASDLGSGGDSARLGRSLLRRCDRAALATTLDGAPYASLVLVAADLDATPLLLLSDLAQHTRNLAAEPRCALLFDGTAGCPEPLAGPRLTVLGRAAPIADARRLARFTNRHPAAAIYAGFADFRLYRLSVERAHLVAGFGRIEWIAGGELLFAGDVAPLGAAEPEIIAHMNADHADALALYAGGLLGLAADGWRMTGIDPEGIDLRREADAARLDFDATVLDAAAARRVLVALVQKARERA